MTILNPTGSAIVDSTFLGGGSYDTGESIAVHPLGIYVTGITLSPNFPTVNPIQSNLASVGVQDAFVTKFLATTADVGVAKAATGAFFAGQDGTFTITVTNSGPGAASGVSVTDVLPAGATFVSATPNQGTCSGTSTVTCALGTINNTASATITLVVRPSAPGPLSNTASVTTTSPDPTPANNSATAVVTVAAVSANLSIAKTAAGTFFAGQNGTFTITVTNAGPSPAGAVSVTDILPAGVTFVSATPTQGNCSGTTTVTCTLGTIAAGGTATIALVVRPTTTGPLSNTATATSITADADPANNASTAIVVVQPAPAAAAPVPALDGTTLMLLAALLATLGMWIAGRTTS